MTFQEPGEPTSSGRPPYNYVDGDVNIPAVLNAAGLDPTKYASQDFFVQHGMFALWELFSDGELRIFEAEQLTESEEIARTAGEERHGEFFDKLAVLRQEVLQKGGPLADEINKLARYCGRMLAEFVTEGYVQVPTNKLVQSYINPASGHVSLQFDEHRWQGNHPAGVILEYGPGVGGKRFIDSQLISVALGKAPFQYFAISDGPFVNQFLMSYLGNRLEAAYGPGARDIAGGGRLLLGREDGMLQATDGLLATPQPSGSHEICDVILATGLHEAEAAELEFAIKNSPRLLRSDGEVFISAPTEKVRPTSTTFAEQVGWALDAGLEVTWQKELVTGDYRLGTETTSGLAVLKKPQ